MKSLIYTGLAGFCAPVILAGKALKGTGKGLQIAGRKVEETGEKTEAKGRQLGETTKAKAIEAKAIEHAAAEERAAAKAERRLEKLARTKCPADEIVDACLRKVVGNARTVDV